MQLVPTNQAFLEQAVECSHNRRISQPPVKVLDHIPHVAFASLPKNIHDVDFERAQRRLLQWLAKLSEAIFEEADHGRIFWFCLLDSASEIIPGLSDAPDRIPGFYAQSHRFQVRMIPPALPQDLIRTMLATGRDGGRRQEAIKRTCLQATAPYLIASTWWIVPGTLPTERKSLAAVTFFAGRRAAVRGDVR